MSKRRNRSPLADFATGFLASVQRDWQTQRAEKAQALRDERLAQIAQASQERGFAFQGEQAQLGREFQHGEGELTREQQTALADKQIAAQQESQAAQLAASRENSIRSEAGADRRSAAGIAAQTAATKERGDLYKTSDGGTIRITNDAAGDRMLLELQKRGVQPIGKVGYEQGGLMGEPGAGMMKPGMGRGAPAAPAKTTFQWGANGQLVPGGG